MTTADDRILEYLGDLDATAMPAELAETDVVRFSPSYIADRCRRLARFGSLDRGALASIGSPRRQASLDSELDVSGVEPVEGG